MVSFNLGAVSQILLSTLMSISIEKTVFSMVVSELKSVSRLKIFVELTGPWCLPEWYFSLREVESPGFQPTIDFVSSTFSE